MGKNFMKKPMVIKTEPWLAPESIEFIEGKLTKESRVLETGAGGSTFWFAERVAYVLSFEHNPAWSEKIKAELLKRNVSNVRLIHDRSYPREGLNLGKELFDMALIDGRGRCASVRSSFDNIVSGGFIILDNSERRRYTRAINYLSSLCPFQITFYGEEGNTTIWQKQ